MLIQTRGDRAAFPFLVAIETDPQRSGSASRRPLGQGDAQQLLAHLAADLGGLLDGVRKCRLAAAGALFDQCQVLRPGMPMFHALSEAAQGASTDGSSPGLAAVGRSGETTPGPPLEPEQGIPLGILRLIPLVVEGPRELVKSLGQDMEHRFLGEGQLSAHAASWLEAAFSIGVRHARFMTLTDLNAMLRLQLEHFGYLPLWELLDAGLTKSGEPLELVTDKGARYHWRDGAAIAQFETFDHWAGHGAGRTLPADGDVLPQGYAEWSRELRRYSSTLAAHHIEVRFELPENASGKVRPNFLWEELPADAVQGAGASITEHSWPDLGVIAITAQLTQGLRHYYPLSSKGLNEIHDALQALELAGEGVAFPGRIEFGRASRKLRAAAMESG